MEIPMQEFQSFLLMLTKGERYDNLRVFFSTAQG